MKFVQFTDTHLVPEGERLYGLDPFARLEACIDNINAQHADAEFVMVTGDLADRGKAEAYTLLHRAVSRLKPPCHLLLGNHDDRALFLNQFPDSRRDENGFIQYTLETPIGPFVCLDTNEAGKPWGGLCAKRLDWLARELDRIGDRPLWLFMHHPPFKVGIKRMDQISLLEPEGFARVVEGRRNIRHLFFGHLHRPIAGSWRGIPVSTLRATAHQVALDLNIEGVVPGCHEPPQYAVVLADAEQTIVHSHDYLDRTYTFTLERRYALAGDPAAVGIQA